MVDGWVLTDDSAWIICSATGWRVNAPVGDHARGRLPIRTTTYKQLRLGIAIPKNSRYGAKPRPLLLHICD